MGGIIRQLMFVLEISRQSRGGDRDNPYFDVPLSLRVNESLRPCGEERLGSTLAFCSD